MINGCLVLFLSLQGSTPKIAWPRITSKNKFKRSIQKFSRWLDHRKPVASQGTLARSRGSPGAALEALGAAAPDACVPAEGGHRPLRLSTGHRSHRHRCPAERPQVAVQFVGAHEGGRLWCGRLAWGLLRGRWWPYNQRKRWSIWKLTFLAMYQIDTDCRERAGCWSLTVLGVHSFWSAYESSAGRWRAHSRNHRRSGWEMSQAMFDLQKKKQKCSTGSQRFDHWQPQFPLCQPKIRHHVRHVIGFYGPLSGSQKPRFDVAVQAGDQAAETGLGYASSEEFSKGFAVVEATNVGVVGLLMTVWHVYVVSHVISWCKENMVVLIWYVLMFKIENPLLLLVLSLSSFVIDLRRRS